MILPVSNIQNVLRTYDKQLRVARLNSEVKREVIQGQVDRVKISEEARQMFAQKTQDASSPDSDLNIPGDETPGVVKSETPDTVEDYDF